MIYNNLEAISKLTTIPKNNLDKLVQKSIWCICDNLINNHLQSEKLTEIDIGLGILSIYDGEDIRYKFTPSSELEDYVKNTLLNYTNPLQCILEKTLKNKIIETYKDIL